MRPYRHRVNYYETDKMGITHHANYIHWMEEARIDMMDQLGWPYDKLEELSIPFTRVDHDHADTIEFCLEVEQVLGAKICKNLFLTNSQKTKFYLLLMPGDKPFKTKYLSAQLGCSRLSFADAGHMEEYLHTIPGSVSALELLFDVQGKVQLVIDRPLLAGDTISGHPGISTSTLRMRREDLLNYVEAVGHSPIYVDLPDPRETGEA